MSAALTLCGSVSARQWNFTKWSAGTISTMKAADTYWTNDEKGDGTTNVVPNDACLWNVNATLATACDADSNLLAADGTIIPELEGLKWAGIGAKKVAIAFDYQTTTDKNQWGPFNGPAYLWLNGKTTAVHFIIPKVAPGTVVKMGVETHKMPAENPEARGVDIYVGDTKLTMDPSSYPTTMAEYTWTVPEDYTESVDLDVRPSNGCHLYYISVDEGDVVINTEDIKVAYLYDGTYNGAKDADKNPAGWLANGGLEADGVYVGGLSDFNTTLIDYSTTTLTSETLNDSLLNFDVVVLSEAVSSGNALAKGIYSIVNKVPMLNLKSFMYKSGVWGVGAGNNPSPKATTITVNEDYMDDELFEGVNMDEGVITLYETDDVDAVVGNMVQGCTPSADGLFGADEVIATVPNGESSYTAIHTHGTKNKYMLLPLSSDNYNVLGGDAYLLISNAVKMLYKTKSSVQKAGTPTVTEDRTNNSTTVTLASTATDATVYYALGEGEFTTYSEPFVVTADSTLVRAYAIAHGYDDSDTASVYVRVFGQASAPVIATYEEEGYTLVSLSQSEGSSIYYSFNGITDTARCAAFDADFKVTEPCVIYAFAAADGQLSSEMVTRTIHVGGIPAVKDTVAHFTANEEDWFTNAKIYNSSMEEQETPTSNWAAKAAYYWGKSAWSCYSDEVDHTEIVYDEDGVTPLKSLVDVESDSIKNVYKLNPEAVRYVYSTTDTQWRLRSQGQTFTGETNVSPSYLAGKGDNSSYYAETVFDLIGEPTKGKLTFGGKTSGEPYTASVESVVKFSGELDIVTYITNGAGSNIYLELQTSTDQENWTLVDTVKIASVQRNYAKDRNHINLTEPSYIRLAQVGGSSKAQVYDIYVITTEGTTGIEAISAKESTVADDRIFDLMGRRVNSKVAGQLYIQNGKKVVVR